jgi:exosome complex RNA-binding protein Csl4
MSGAFFMETRESFSIWTVYEKPTDYPEEFIARRSEIRPGEVVHTDDIIRAEFLATIRRDMQERGLYRMPRHDTDEAQIVECWI